jgi:hypothetical protein
MAVIGLVLLFLLTVATNNRQLYERITTSGCLAINMCWLPGLLLLVLHVDHAAALAAALAPAQVWQSLAAQTGDDFCPGRRAAGGADLYGVLPICLALD